MPEKPAAEKTEQPTPKRIRKAREKGQVPQSKEFASAIVVIVLFSGITYFAPSVIKWMTYQIRDGLSANYSVFSDAGTFTAFGQQKLIQLSVIVLPFFAVLFVGSMASVLVVSGLNFSPKAIECKLSSINPVSGFGKLFGAKSMVNLGLSIVKLTFMSLIVWFYIQDRLDAFAAFRWATTYQILVGISKIVFDLLVRVCIGLLIIGFIDLAYQKFKYTKDLKMTKQEVKQERKETEGSPELKSRIRMIQIQMASKRMLADVPKADIILVNPTHYAVALKYNSKIMDSPVLLAKGKDQVAEKIRTIARAHGVPIIRRPELTRAIYKSVDIGKSIPEILYAAVAEVLAMLYRIKHNR